MYFQVTASICLFARESSPGFQRVCVQATATAGQLDKFRSEVPDLVFAREPVPKHVNIIQPSHDSVSIPTKKAVKRSVLWNK